MTVHTFLPRYRVGAPRLKTAKTRVLRDEGQGFMVDAGGLSVRARVMSDVSDGRGPGLDHTPELGGNVAVVS
jgi:hypothetical protein